MATFVMVHGGFGGGWEWTEVAGIFDPEVTASVLHELGSSVGR